MHSRQNYHIKVALLISRILVLLRPPCRKCGNVGHFTEVHDISDPHYRQLVVNTLGINLWGDWEAGQQDQSGAKVQSSNTQSLAEKHYYQC